MQDAQNTCIKFEEKTIDFSAFPMYKMQYKNVTIFYGHATF